MLKTLRNVALAVFACALASGLAQAEETRIFTDDAGRAVEIPVKPERIVSLHDLFFTLPLIELGKPPIGSHGRLLNDGTAYLRSSKMLTGIDFDNSDIAFVGSGIDIDPEAVAAVQPDLIILSTNQKPEMFEKIAPTVLLDFRKSDKYALYDQLAKITGTEDALRRLKSLYQSQIEQVKTAIDPAKVSVNVIAAIDGNVRSYRHYAALGKALNDAGFAMPEAVRHGESGQYADFSPEMLPEMDADIVIVTYRADFGHGPQVAYEELEALVPGFCRFLTACQEGRLYAIPRGKTFASSYGALGTLAYTVLALATPLAAPPATGE